MRVVFQSDREKAAFSDARRRRKGYGDVLGKKIGDRLDDLEAADCLDDMRHLPGRCHALREDRAGQFAVSLEGNTRLVFTPDHNPVPQLPAGGPDWNQITRITILEVVDYHGK